MGGGRRGEVAGAVGHQWWRLREGRRRKGDREAQREDATEACREICASKTKGAVHTQAYLNGGKRIFA